MLYMLYVFRLGCLRLWSLSPKLGTSVSSPVLKMLSTHNFCGSKWFGIRQVWKQMKLLITILLDKVFWS